MKKFIKVTVLLCLIAVVFGGCQKKAETSSVVKVAVITSYSGAGTRMSEIYHASIDAAMKAINADNTLKHGYVLDYTKVDDKGTVDGAPPAAALALDQIGCHVAIGHYLTIQCLASGPFFEEKKVPLLGIVSGPASVSQGFKYFCMETATDLFQADTLLQYLIEEKKFDKIGLIHINTEGGMSAANRIEETLQNKYSLKVVSRDAMTNEDNDFTAQVLKMKAGGVQAVIYWGLDSAIGAVLYRQIEQMWGRVPEDVLFCGGTNMAQIQATQSWGAEDLAGVVYPSAFIQSKEPHVARFMADVKEADPLHMDAGDVGARVYDAVYHIVHALNALGAYDTNQEDFPDKLNTALRNAKFVGVQGNFDFSAWDNGIGLSKTNVGTWLPDQTQLKIFSGK
jgi:ABC-type branched-subunit amino acid transport system substrate-binding protein